jgi:hypothetical protein
MYQEWKVAAEHIELLFFNFIIAPNYKFVVQT